MPKTIYINDKINIYIITVASSNLIRSKLMSVFKIISGAERKAQISYKPNKRIL